MYRGGRTTNFEQPYTFGRLAEPYQLNRARMAEVYDSHIRLMGGKAG